jgi:hypothetical protein
VKRLLLVIGFVLMAAGTAQAHGNLYNREYQAIRQWANTRPHDYVIRHCRSRHRQLGCDVVFLLQDPIYNFPQTTPTGNVDPVGCIIHRAHAYERADGKSGLRIGPWRFVPWVPFWVQRSGHRLFL